MRKLLVLLISIGSLFLSACADSRIYTPIRISCWDIHTGKVEENTTVAGIAVGSGWSKTQSILLDYTDMNWQEVIVDLTNKKCAIAAYRDDVKIPYKKYNKNKVLLKS